MVCVKSSEKTWIVLLAHFILSGMQWLLTLSPTYRSVFVCVVSSLTHRLGPCDFVNCFPHYLYYFTLEIAKYFITDSTGLLCSRKLDLSKISKLKSHRKDKADHLKVFLNTVFCFFFFSWDVWWFQRLEPLV